MLQAGEAIAEAHGLGIVHRDLKPPKLVPNEARGWLAVRQSARFWHSLKMAISSPAQAMTATMAVMGSPLYMSPEQLSSARDVDMRTDVWSLGVICFELLSGRTPFRAETLPQLCMAVTCRPSYCVTQFAP